MVFSPRLATPPKTSIFLFSTGAKAGGSKAAARGKGGGAGGRRKEVPPTEEELEAGFLLLAPRGGAHLTQVDVVQVGLDILG